MAFSETWLPSTDTGSELSVSGFGEPIRLDRDANVTGNLQGGGVCVYINQRWCSNFTIREAMLS